MKYTAAQRHKIYKKALKTLTDIGIGATICCQISKNQRGTWELYAEEVTEENYPEVHLFHREEIPVQSSWFTELELNAIDRLEIRKIILEFCIEMTRPE